MTVDLLKTIIAFVREDRPHIRWATEIGDWMNAAEALADEVERFRKELAELKLTSASQVTINQEK